MINPRKGEYLTCPDGDLYIVLKGPDSNSVIWDDGSSFYRLRCNETLQEVIVSEYVVKRQFHRPSK